MHSPDLLAIPDTAQLVRVGSRLVIAIFIGALIGLQRELTHKPAGLRTHMLVALGTAVFIVGAAESGMLADSVSRIVQGLATGIGFLGAGAIVRPASEGDVHGLAGAGGVWLCGA